MTCFYVENVFPLLNSKIYPFAAWNQKIRGRNMSGLEFSVTSKSWQTWSSGKQQNIQKRFYKTWIEKILAVQISYKIFLKVNFEARKLKLKFSVLPKLRGNITTVEKFSGFCQISEIIALSFLYLIGITILNQKFSSTKNVASN